MIHLIAKEQDGISLRYSFPQEMARKITGNGFEIVQVYGEWDKEGTIRKVNRWDMCVE